MISPWKARIHDWDEPSVINDKRCDRFLKYEYNHFGMSIPYRLFLPDPPPGKNEKIPLVLLLHGADVTGIDNELHIRAHDIGGIYAGSDFADTPVAVLAPQYRDGASWTKKGMMAALEALIYKTVSDHLRIDSERICALGYSAGGIGAMKLMKRRPNLFYRALIMCAATKGEDLDALKNTPIWLFHAEDDNIVPCRGTGTGRMYDHLGSADIYEALHEDMGDDIHFTMYEKGELSEKYRVNPHCVWVPVAKDIKALKWLIGE